MKQRFENIALDMDKEFNKFLDLVKDKIDFSQFAPDEADLVSNEIYNLYFSSIINAIALSLTKEDYIKASNEIADSPYNNPLEIFLSYAIDDPRIDEFVSQELDILLEQILETYKLES